MHKILCLICAIIISIAKVFPGMDVTLLKMVEFLRLLPRRIATPCLKGLLVGLKMEVPPVIFAQSFWMRGIRSTVACVSVSRQISTFCDLIIWKILRRFSRSLRPRTFSVHIFNLLKILG